MQSLKRPGSHRVEGPKANLTLLTNATGVRDERRGLQGRVGVVHVVMVIMVQVSSLVRDAMDGCAGVLVGWRSRVCDGVFGSSVGVCFRFTVILAQVTNGRPLCSGE